MIEEMLTEAGEYANGAEVSSAGGEDEDVESADVAEPDADAIPF